MSGVHKDHGPSCDGCLMVGVIDRAERAEARADRLAAGVRELVADWPGLGASVHAYDPLLGRLRALLDPAVDAATVRPVSLERGDDGATEVGDLVVDPVCAERNPDLDEWHGSCCRFPKSCSPYITKAQLEARAVGGADEDDQ